MGSRMNKKYPVSSSGNVRVWISYKSLVMEYVDTCIPGRMDNLHMILKVADVKCESTARIA